MRNAEDHSLLIFELQVSGFPAGSYHLVHSFGVEFNDREYMSCLIILILASKA